MNWMNFYFFSLIFCSISLLILIFMIHGTNCLTRKEKHSFYITYVYMIVIFFIEYLGNFLNGNAKIEWFLKIVKFLDYSLTPFVSILFVRQIFKMKRMEQIFFGLLVLNTIYEFLSMFFGWNFKVIDGVYQHGPTYFLYLIISVLALLYVAISFYFFIKSHGKGNIVSLILICVFTFAGIILQETLVNNEVKTVMLGLTLGSFLLFIHYIFFASEKKQEEINQKERLLKEDPLTGLDNRYSYNLELNKNNKSAHLREDLTIFVCDVNHLKKVNDTFGHEAGDELIVAGGKILFSVFSAYGKCFRTGGDEFVVIANMEKGKEKDLIRQIDEKTSKFEGKEIHGFSMSVGYARHTDYPSLNFEKLINTADENMYLIKKRFHERENS